MAAPVTFWFAIGSTYTYLAVMRADDVAKRHGVTLDWRPVDIRHVLVTHDNDPFGSNAVKANYMWHDIGRHASSYGLSPNLPAPYPLPDSPFANRVAFVAQQEGWVREYARTTYGRWFEHGEICDEDPNLSASIGACGHEAERVIALANTDETRAGLLAQTQGAMARGLFGVPTFMVDGELFWGNDRLEDALSWATTGRLATRN